MSRRPDTLKPPAHLSKNPPVPEPRPPELPAPGQRDATRYGDWELKGVAVDF